MGLYLKQLHMILSYLASLTASHYYSDSTQPPQFLYYKLILYLSPSPLENKIDIL